MVTCNQKEEPKITTKNSRNARLLLCATLSGTYVAVTKTHGLKFNVPTDFSEDTGHGATFKGYIPGLQDFKLAIQAWYDTAYTTLESMSLNKISEYFQAYIDFSDTLNYYRGQIFVGQDEFNLDLGSTVGSGYTGVIANADIAIVRAGSTL